MQMTAGAALRLFNAAAVIADLWLTVAGPARSEVDKVDRCTCTAGRVGYGSPAPPLSAKARAAATPSGVSARCQWHCSEPGSNLTGSYASRADTMAATASRHAASGAVRPLSLAISLTKSP